MQLATEFTQVVKKNSRSVKTNATFNLIEQLLSEKNALISGSGYKCVSLQTDTSKAFIFQIDAPPENLHFETEGFVFVERHLRVDKLYSLPTSVKGQNGFTSAHYTENYRNPITHETITVHLYYAEPCQYMQIRKNNGIENEVWVEDITIEKSVQINAFEAIAFYKKLVNEKNNRHFAALKAADDAEKAIKKMWHAMASKEQIQRYISAIDDFCVLINNVNFYNELEKDCSDVLMRKVQVALRKKLLNVQEPVIKTAPDPAVTKVSSAEIQNTQEEPGAAVKPKPKKPAANLDQKQEFETIMQLAAALKQCLAKLTPKTLVDGFQIVSDLTLKLLLFNLPKKSKKNAYQQKLIEIEALIKSLPDIRNYAKERAIAGDLEAIQTLFPILTFNIQYHLFFTIQDKLTSEKTNDSSELAHKLRAIFQFFYEHSPYYHGFISLQSGFMTANNKASSGFSLLFNAALSQKFLTFAMLIDHGIDVDGLSFFHADLTFSHLKALAFFDCGANYIFKLLEKGATVDSPKMKLSGYAKQSDKTKTSIANILKRPTKFNNATDEDYYVALLGGTHTSDLSLVCHNNNFSAIPALLNKTTLINTVHALAQCVNLKGITKRLVTHSTQRGLFFFPSVAEANTFTYKIFSPLGEALNIAIVVYLTDPTITPSLPEICKLMNHIKEQCQKYMDKLPLMILALEALAKKVPEIEKDIYYLACEILYAELIHDDKSINPELNLQINREYRQKLMRTCCLHGATVQKKLPDRPPISYQEATLVAKHDDLLQSTPIYKYAREKLSSQHKAAPFKVFFPMGNNADTDDESSSPRLDQ